MNFLSVPTGPLPPELREQLDWSKLKTIVRAAILGQPASVRAEMGDKAELLFRCRDFDAAGYCTIDVLASRDDDAAAEWLTMVRVHWTRLMPGAEADLFTQN